MRRACLLWVLLLLAKEARAQEVFTHTGYVEDLAAAGTALWAATRGGVEVYDLQTGARRRLYTTADGLSENAAQRISIEKGAVAVQLGAARCTLDVRADRFRCASAPPPPLEEPRPAPAFAGARVTRRLQVTGLRGAAVEVFGTAGAGLFREAPGGARRLTPAGQICSNHVVAVAAFGGRLWFGTFDEGLCSYDGRRFHAAAVPARMVNDLVATPAGLYVATSAGLFRSADGRAFRPEPAVTEPAVNDLATDGTYLYATTPAALFRVALRKGAGKDRAYWRPAGSRALQAVSPDGQGGVWLASEDRGAIHLDRGRFTAWDRAAGLPTSWALDVAALPGAAYVATLRHGLVRLGPGGRAAALPGLPDRWILHVSEDRGGLWIGTQGGAARVEADGRVQALAGVAHPCVHVVFPEGPGGPDGEVVWVGSEGGTTRHRLPPAGSPKDVSSGGAPSPVSPLG